MYEKTLRSTSSENSVIRCLNGSLSLRGKYRLSGEGEREEKEREGKSEEKEREGEREEKEREGESE